MTCLLQSVDGCATLLDHAAGRLLGRKAREVSLHVTRCPECSSFVLQQSNVWDLMDVFEPAPVSMTFNRELYAKIRQSETKSWLAVFTRLFDALVARPAFPLAALSLLVIAGLSVDRTPTPASAVRSSIPAPTAVSPNDAEQLDKALDDIQLLHQLDLVKDEAADASRGM